MYVRAVGEHVFVAFRPSDRYSYSYLLGLFLGEGISVCGATAVHSC